MSSPFDLFCSDRVCALKDGYVEAMQETVTVKDLYKAWSRWRAEMSSVKRMSLEEFKARCDDKFGHSNQDGVYNHVKVFLDEDDVYLFKRESQLNAVKEDDLTLSSDALADQILSNPIRKELVRGLIEDKRRLYKACEQIETKEVALHEVVLSALKQIESLREELIHARTTIPRWHL